MRALIASILVASVSCASFVERSSVTASYRMQQIEMMDSDSDGIPNILAMSSQGDLMWCVTLKSDNTIIWDTCGTFCDTTHIHAGGLCQVLATPQQGGSGVRYLRIGTAAADHTSGRCLRFPAISGSNQYTAQAEAPFAITTTYSCSSVTDLNIRLTGQDISGWSRRFAVKTTNTGWTAKAELANPSPDSIAILPAETTAVPNQRVYNYCVDWKNGKLRSQGVPNLKVEYCIAAVATANKIVKVAQGTRKGRRSAPYNIRCSHNGNGVCECYYETVTALQGFHCRASDTIPVYSDADQLIVANGENNNGWGKTAFAATGTGSPCGSCQLCQEYKPTPDSGCARMTLKNGKIRAFGDPHIASWSGKHYDIVGDGNYHLLQIPSKSGAKLDFVGHVANKFFDSFALSGSWIPGLSILSEPEFGVALGDKFIAFEQIMLDTVKLPGGILVGEVCDSNELVTSISSICRTDDLMKQARKANIHSVPAISLKLTDQDLGFTFRMIARGARGQLKRSLDVLMDVREKLMKQESVGGLLGNKDPVCDKTFCTLKQPPV